MKLKKLAKSPITKKAAEPKKITKKYKPKMKIVKKDAEKPAKKKLIKKAPEIDCEEAVKTIKKQESKKAEIALHRAEAPKKKLSVTIPEKLLKYLRSVFKTKQFKGNDYNAEIFVEKTLEAWDLINGEGERPSFFKKMQDDAYELIEKTYKKPADVKEEKQPEKPAEKPIEEVDNEALPADTQEQVDKGLVTYRGTGMSGKNAGMYKLKVHGKEYIVTIDQLRSFEKDGNQIRFSAPFRKG
jgi:hypothetical protein